MGRIVKQWMFFGKGIFCFFVINNIKSFRLH